jgi:cytidylate kinase
MGQQPAAKARLPNGWQPNFGYDYLDTGALYRAVALRLLNAGANSNKIDEKQAVNAASTLNLLLTQTAEIRTDKVAALASIVAAIGPVRAELLSLQRAFAAAPPSGRGAVLDGRDIGTIVLPDANLKFFIDADLDIRAERRTKELLQAEQSVMFRDVLADMKGAR